MKEDFRIKVFLTVVSEGGFKKAADVLGISQSAVSQRIADLEKDLGVKIFSRNRLIGSIPEAESQEDPLEVQAESRHSKTRPYISLTTAGQLFMPYAEKIAASFAEASSLFTTYKSYKPIRIATTSFVSSTILPTVLKPLTAATGAAFITDIFPEGTDFEAIIAHTRTPDNSSSASATRNTNDDIFHPYRDSDVIAIWTAYDPTSPSHKLAFLTAASPQLSESPLYAQLRNFLGL